MSNPESNIVPMPIRTYSAKPFRVLASGHEYLFAGTLDGWIDFALFDRPTEENSDGHAGTRQMTCDDARALIAALHGVINDIQKNCLYDRDLLLMPEVSVGDQHVQ